ncbi:glycosyl transferase family 1 [Vibrio sp. MACH09]|uniref:glycosyltransferase family 4 protein n=1 Tax=Vibrio sp. MACH09 TaxID=3025122 RepID=UPI002793829A|nr:glycosyltransferase family 4 protein [Vibrio sp. MACH09]GLO59659.1 glycosyl transferase family 1 [Vibrio sp. MACH09]
MKVLHVTTVIQTAKAFLLPYAASFQSKGWQVDIATNIGNDFSLENHKNTYHIDFSRRPIDFISHIKSFFQMRKLVKNNSYNIVHVHTPIASLITRFALIGISETKVFYTAHGFHFIEGNSKILNFFYILLEKVAGLCTDHLFVINEHDYKSALRYKIVPEICLSRLYGIGVNVEVYKHNESLRRLTRDEIGINDDSVCILHIAELNKNKNQMIVLSAINKIISNNMTMKNFVYVVVGDGLLKEELVNYTIENGIERYIMFLGYRNDIPELLSASDIVSLSSFREGLPRCLLEAMCNEKPILASDIRGCKDLLKTGAGLLASPDSKTEWALNLLKMIESSELQKTCGKKGRDLVTSHYRECSVIDQVLSVYEQKGDI